jgi:hypothetical protein
LSKRKQAFLHKPRQKHVIMSLNTRSAFTQA